VRGAKVPDELLAALKEQRDEVIVEWQRRQEQARDRYAVVPTGEVPLCGQDMILAAMERNAVVSHVFRQPRPVHAWVMARASSYHERGVKADDCEWRACVDVVAWQRSCGGRQAVQFLVDLPTNEELVLARSENKI
jgi:hypothetical protein